MSSPSFFLGLVVGDAFVFPPLQSVLLPPAGHELVSRHMDIISATTSWPQDERQEECAPPISANRVSGSSFGFHSDAGRLAPARISNFTACLARFRLGHHVSVGTCRRLLGLMAAASPVLPPGLLHMRPFLWWMKELRLHPTVPATCLVRVSRSCSRPLLPWRDPAFLQNGVRMGAIHRRHLIAMDASITGWARSLKADLRAGNRQESSSLVA